MFPFKPRRKTAPGKAHAMPVWVFWGTIIFVAIVLYFASLSPEPDQPSQLDIAMGNIRQNLPEFGQYCQMMPTRERVRMEPLVEGNGVRVLCGQRVQLQYHAYAGEVSLAEQTLEIDYGSSALLPFIGHALKTVPVGATHRFYFTPPEPIGQLLPEQAADAAVSHLDVAIVSATPNYSGLLNSSALPLQINDKQVSMQQPAACRDAVAVHLRLWDAAGQEYFASTADSVIEFTIGKHQLMHGLEQGVIGMGIGGMRTLTLPPAWQEQGGQAGATELQKFAAPTPGIIIAEIRRVK